LSVAEKQPMGHFRKEIILKKSRMYSIFDADSAFEGVVRVLEKKC